MSAVLTEILTVGDELCRGEIVDTNAAWLAEMLWELDVTVGWITTCRDVPADIRAVVATAAARADLVITSGGLGPTVDDVTAEVVAELGGAQLEVHQEARRRMEKRYAAANFRVTPNNLRQVRAPASARVFLNPVGAAPGFELAVAGTPVVCLPGPPRELRALFDGAVRDRVVELREARGERIERIARRIFRVFGKGESHVAQALEGVLDGVDGVDGASLHFQVAYPETLVKVVVRAGEQAAADQGLATIDGRVRDALGYLIYGIDDDSLAAALGRALVAADATLCTAESCTGGMIGSLVTSVSGSSRYFAGGAVTYENSQKVRMLGVSEQTLAEHGAVSEQCAREMARGARERFGTDYAAAATGIAGPGGGTEDKPVGLVWLAVAGPGSAVSTRKLAWPGARDRVRTLAAHAALALVLRAVKEAT